MKNLVLIVILCITYISNAQTLSYNDLGVLFAGEQINGTARYNGMSGAFGALGGDLSAMEANPAGAAIFVNSEYSLSLDIRSSTIGSTFYGTKELTENDYLSLSQAGGVFVFKNYNRNNSGWGKFALGFNYSKINDFENMWIASGNSGFAPITDIYDPSVIYNVSDGHYFENITDGRNNKYSFTIASEYNDNLYVGFAVNTYDIEYSQRVLTDEYNSDGGGNKFDISQTQDLITYGDGVSFNFGLISKLNENIRIGLAYQTPVWYNLAEEFVEYDVDIYEKNVNITNEYPPQDTYSGVNGFEYQLKTPSKLTTSFAYIFDKKGLLSVDYIYKNYSNIKLSNGNFSNENQEFTSDLKSVGEFRIGTEWRFDELSIRGGYFTEKSPYKTSISSDNIEGFSIGAGYKFRGAKFDVSYQQKTNTAPYNFYPDSNVVNGAELNFETSKVTATLVLNL
ncbi:OmpP1/FadL family transporter [Lutibacter sp.]|uniref:OmpP1/FadL family transporter n=1 Tax=Lutibacter sp. TaxID=1925666 RepID=UPI002736BFF5|nr:outer membrane protein transport protein [Lutibacter sp.]MDP3311744.1 outer membrane protein transport protein [Lutibacter sp.]